ncbi:hypothetical protein GF319_02170 [Candidatus Bathyarchaeota archaeon]|nr:hypothetical protein [Candidatus Bathyarchaeota archaeon]
MSFIFNQHEVIPGEKDYRSLDVAEMLDGSTLRIPVHIVNGIQSGPVLGIFACIHGSEYYQNRVIKRIVKDIDPLELSGTILAVPVANPYAFRNMSRETPNPPEETVDFANMNRVFPGKRSSPLFGSMESTDISLTMKMASVLSEQIISKCTHIMDYHGQMRGMSLKKMLFNLDPESREMARFFRLGILHDPPGSLSKGNLMPMTDYAGKHGIKCIVPEVGGGGHGEKFEKACEDIAFDGTWNIMKHLNMIDCEPRIASEQFYFRNAPHVRSTKAGYLVTDMSPWDVGIAKEPREVKKGEVLGTIYSPYSLEEIEKIRSPCDGLIYACRVSGVVEPQSEILAVADFEGSKWI